MKLSEFYDQESVFGEDSAFSGPRLDFVSSYINNMKGKIALLDYGCGNGFLRDHLAKHISYYGCDISNALVENKTFKKMKDDKIPFKSNRFDVVFAGEVIEHLVDTDTFAKEVKRVLKPGGILIVTTPNLTCWYNKIIFFFGYQPYFTELSFENKKLGRDIPVIRRVEKEDRPYGHLRLFTKRGLRDFLSYHEFNQTRLKTVPLKVSRPFYAMDSFFALFNSASDTVAITVNGKKK